MSLPAGERIGPYEISEPIGSGGMGEVYLATDTRLKREVAIKILPESFADDEGRLARFQREAEVLASLNHPNIAQIYGIETEADRIALALELVDGETLAERIARAPIPAEEALAIAAQIADALEAAHTVGIIHRDLKPANVKLRSDGTVKVLDFGIAKAIEPATISDGEAPMTTPAMTQAGIILGTAAYMAPEQARGRSVDQRADIWSFGCVLYEMLTGQPAFGGEDVTITLARVLERHADLDTLPGTIAPAVRKTIGLCLEKDPRRRIADIRDVSLALAGRFESETKSSTSAENGARPVYAVAGTVLGLIVGAASVVYLGGDAGTGVSSSLDRASSPILSADIVLPDTARLGLAFDRPLQGFDSPLVALSPDGTRVAYIGQSPNGKLLYWRELAGGDFRPVPGTEGVIHAFFSPDSRSIGVVTNSQLKTISLETGAVAVLANTNAATHGWWNESGWIYFAQNQSRELHRVLADNPGSVERVFETLSLSGGTTGWGYGFRGVMPNDREALLTRDGYSQSRDYGSVELIDFETRERTTLLRNAYGARYVEPGYLVFARAGNLMAVRYDIDARSVVGEERVIARDVAMESLFAVIHASVSMNGMLAYMPGGDLALGRLAWVDRDDGAVEYVDAAPPAVYGVVDISPDGTRIAAEVAGVSDYIWIYDLERRQGRRYVDDEESIGQPRWRPPNGNQILITGRESGRLMMRDVDGGTQSVEIPKPGDGRQNFASSSFSWDGETLGFTLLGNDGAQGFLSLDGSFQPVAIPQSWLYGFSPDKRYFSYTDQSGAYEIYVASYPDASVQRQVADRGIETVWCACGELFFRDGSRWYASRISTDPTLEIGRPELAFDTDFIDTPGISYAVTPDGQRMLVVKRAEEDVLSRLRILTNWQTWFASEEN